jgi:hypothetical protein
VDLIAVDAKSDFIEQIAGSIKVSGVTMLVLTDTW